MKTKKELFGARVKELRRKKGLSQELLAESVGIESKYLSRIEVGKSYPSLETVEKIADALEVEMKDLFDFYHLGNGVTDVRSLEKLLIGQSEEKLRLITKIIKTIVY